MTPKNKQVATWIGIVFGALGGLAIVGMAAAFWISVEVKGQLIDHTKVMVEAIPDTSTLQTDVAAIKATVIAIDSKADTAIENQQRFEEIFMDYLRNEAQR
jgi:hypothetical protein